jgi:hypothetical protein
MTADANTVLEPSSSAPVVESPKLPADPYKWTSEQREHWNRTGEIPETPKKQDSAPASTPEKKAEPEPKGKSAAESGTAPEKQEKRGGKKSAEDRISELIAENKLLKEERERSRKTVPEPTPKADAKPEPKTETQKPTRPNPYTFKGTPEEYEKAMDAWEDSQRQQAKAEARMEAQQAQQQEKLNAKLVEARQRYGDGFDDAVKPAYRQVMESGIDMPVLAVIGSSEYLPDMMYVLGTKPSELADFIALAKSNPVAAIRKAVLMESLIEQELKKPDEKPKAEPKAEAKPESPEPKPRAPKPPTEVGGRGAPAERADLAAARAGNFRDFDAEMRRKYGAGR